MHRRQNTPGVVAAICLFGLIVADVVYGLVTSRDELLGWTQVLLAGLAVFALFAHQITKFVISPDDGVTIEQQIEAFERDLNNIDAISAAGGSDELESLLTESTRLDHNVWTRLIIYRLAMRALLRRMCTQVGIDLHATHSIHGMLSKLVEAGQLSEMLHTHLQRIRQATFAAEWGSGTHPTEQEVQYVLAEAPAVLRSLNHAILAQRAPDNDT